MSLEAFDAAMSEATEAAQVGFHFEEGGCWGMARALFDQFTDMGLSPEIKYKPTGFVHCWVEAGGVAFDWRGSMSQLPAFGLFIPQERLAGIAAHFGCDEEAFEADAYQARQIVEAAVAKLPKTISLASAES